MYQIDINWDEVVKSFLPEVIAKHGLSKKQVSAAHLQHSCFSWSQNAFGKRLKTFVSASNDFKLYLTKEH